MEDAMVKAETIARRAGIHAVSLGGICLIRQSDAKKFVETLYEARTPVIGIERFTQVGESVRPDMDHIADFSSIASDYETSTREALIFVESLPCDEEALLEFTL